MIDRPEIEPHFDVGQLFDRLVDEPRRSLDGHPWVMANMVSTLDGRIALDGRSGSLGGPLDRRMFAAIRALSDVILVGAGTVRAERYRAIHLPDELRARRRALGRPAEPTLAVVSRSLNLPTDTGLLDHPQRLVVITDDDAPLEPLNRLLASGVRVLEAGSGAGAMRGAFAQLARDGANTILTEGGPQVLTELVRADLVDELLLTLAPRLLGAGERLVDGPALPPGPWRADRGWRVEDDWFLRYLAPGRPAPGRPAPGQPSAGDPSGTGASADR
ncbi:MAG: dihydrofolate reductase family protein [Microthrixaceae bacterium]